MRTKQASALLNLRLSPIIAALALMSWQSLSQSVYEPYTFTTLAGGGGFNSPHTAGRAARLNGFRGLSVDKAGNIYVADTFHYAIRKVTPAGEMTTLAGLPGTSGNADGPGSAARFSFPLTIALARARHD